MTTPERDVKLFTAISYAGSFVTFALLAFTGTFAAGLAMHLIKVLLFP